MHRLCLILTMLFAFTLVFGSTVDDHFKNATITTTVAPDRKLIEEKDVIRLRDSLRAGKLLMASPMNLDGKWTVLIIYDTDLWLYNVSTESFSYNQLHLFGNQAPVLLRKKWPKLFTVPQSANAQDVYEHDKLFEKWQADNKIVNMYSFSHIQTFTLQETNFVIITSNTNSTFNLTNALRYRTPYHNDDLEFQITRGVVLNVVYSNDKQGIWIASRLKGNLSLMAIGEAGDGSNQTRLDVFTRIEHGDANDTLSFERTILSDVTTVDSKYNMSAGMQICIIDNEIEIIKPSKQCAKAVKPQHNMAKRPFADVYRGFIGGKHFYFFSKKYVYIFPLATYQKPEKRQPLKRIDFDRFVKFRNRISTIPWNEIMTDHANTTATSKYMEETTAKSTSTTTIIIVVSIIFAILIGGIICYCNFFKSSNSDKPPLKETKTPQAKGQSKKSAKTTSNKKTTKNIPKSNIPKSQAEPKSKMISKAEASSTNGGKLSQPTSRSIASKPMLLKGKSEMSSTAKSSISSKVKSRAAGSTKAKSNSSKAKNHKTVMGKAMSSVLSLGAQAKNKASGASSSSSTNGPSKSMVASGPKSTKKK